MKERRIQPEWLDQLPGQSPAALRSRLDLRRINALMGNARRTVAAWEFAASQGAPRRLVDLGAGDGHFLLSCVRRWASAPTGMELVLVDRNEAIDARVVSELGRLGFRARGERADAWEWLRQMPWQPGSWVVANLFLHHFSAEELRGLFDLLVDKCELCCACEPRRAWWPRMASGMLCLIGANAVTRQDAVLSVRAGFQAEELSALWPDREGWRLRERRTGMFGHFFLAQKK